MSTAETFEYQNSAEKCKNTKLVEPNRKRLFENEMSSDDEVDHKDKKAKVERPIITGPMIFKSYQGKEYEKCLEMIDEIFKESKYSKDPVIIQYKIIQAACWTMLEIHREKINKQLMEIIENDPKNSFARYGYGLYMYHEGNMQKATEAFGLAIDLNPSGAMKKALELKAKAKQFTEMVTEGEIRNDRYLNDRLILFLYSNSSIRKKLLLASRRHVERRACHRSREYTNDCNGRQPTRLVCQRLGAQIGSGYRERLSR
jgi:tetratricopeptide (TPR) repeat protein